MGMMVYSLLWCSAGFISSTVGRPLGHVAVFLIGLARILSTNTFRRL